MDVKVDDLLFELPPYLSKKELVQWGQSTNAIIKQIVKNHEEYESEYDTIYKYFDTGDIDSTARKIFNFCKQNFEYSEESEESQSVKSPSAILCDDTVDCKHYSLFIGGVLDAIEQNEQDGYWTWHYRFAGYHGNKIEHVFVVVVLDDGREIWVDPVLHYYDQRKQPTYYKDKKPKPMALYKISGTGEPKPTTITVDDQAAIENFLVMVNVNALGIKSMLRRNMSIVNSQVKQYFAANGYDFDHFLIILNQ